VTEPAPGWGRWALVTGSSRGIGAEVAVALAGRGLAVVLCYRERAGAAAEVAGRVRASGVGARAVRLDLADSAGCGQVAAELADALGPPAAVVHAGGEVLRASLADTDPDRLLRLFHVNVFAPFAVDRALAGPMTRAGGGSITHVGSVIGPLGTRNRAAYAASKSALVGLTTALAVELAPAVRVNCVLPGVVDTDMNAGLAADPAALDGVTGRIPLGRLGAAAECAAVIAFLATDAHYVTGTCLTADGGLAARLAVPAADTAR
jgi:NAD(P)-dependent dehydrogenase (short-subunit alcohol dehydrogenase family)